MAPEGSKSRKNLTADIANDNTKPFLRRQCYLLTILAVSLLTLGSFLQFSFASSSLAFKYDDLTESILGTRGTSHRTAVSFTAVHRPAVRDALDRLRAAGNGTTEYTPVVNGTSRRVDLTPNYPRIHDFLHERATPVERIIHRDTTTSNEEESDAKTKQDEPLNIVLFYADDWTMKVR